MTTDPPRSEDDSPAGGATAPPDAASSVEAAGDVQEPVTMGTLFVMLVFLMALAGLWAIMYLILLER